MDHYAVIGNPVAHSKSPRIHALFAAQTGEPVAYDAVLAPLDGFTQTAHDLVKKGYRGFNVTVPFKEEAYRLADKMSSRAERACAVNTLIVHGDGTLFGDNTDGAGLVCDLIVNHEIAVTGMRILILGAGGAVRGALKPLLELSPVELVIANRTADKAVRLADEFARLGPVEGCGLDALGDRQFDLVINGTSAGLAGEVPPLPGDCLAPGAVCYDMLYGDEPTPFLRWATTHGAERVFDGLGMLVEQAAESFLLWRGVRPDTAPVIAGLRPETGSAAKTSAGCLETSVDPTAGWLDGLSLLPVQDIWHMRQCLESGVTERRYHEQVWPKVDIVGVLGATLFHAMMVRNNRGALLLTDRLEFAPAVGERLVVELRGSAILHARVIRVETRQRATDLQPLTAIIVVDEAAR